jgi:hypothetical protein
MTDRDKGFDQNHVTRIEAESPGRVDVRPYLEAHEPRRCSGRVGTVSRRAVRGANATVVVPSFLSDHRDHYREMPFTHSPATLF